MLKRSCTFFPNSPSQPFFLLFLLFSAKVSYDLRQTRKRRLQYVRQQIQQDADHEKGSRRSRNCGHWLVPPSLLIPPAGPLLLPVLAIGHPSCSVSSGLGAKSNQNQINCPELTWLSSRIRRRQTQAIPHGAASRRPIQHLVGIGPDQASGREPHERLRRSLKLSRARGRGETLRIQRAEEVVK